MTASLTDDAVDALTVTSEYLVDAWSLSQQDGAEDNLWERERDAILRESDFRWTATGSGRIVCGLSRTLDGAFVADDGSPVVVKFEPWLSDGEWDEARSDNQHELTIWRKAVELGDDDLFAPVLDHGDGCRWLAMEECLPIFPGHPGPTDDGHGGDYLRSPKFGDNPDYIGELKDRFEERGWYEHDYKHGNVGLRQDGTVVLLDYGSFTKPPEE